MTFKAWNSGLGRHEAHLETECAAAILRKCHRLTAVVSLWSCSIAAVMEDLTFSTAVVELSLI